MRKTITCIVCPRGCRLVLSQVSGQVEVDGYRCPKGEVYGRQEALNPLRVLTTTVRTDLFDIPRVPVRLAPEIPLNSIGDFMHLVAEIRLTTSCLPGDIIAADLGGRGVNVIATGAFDHA